jgi:hypothetical protein
MVSSKLTIYRFFLKSQAADIVPPMQAQLDISSACISTIKRGLDLLPLELDHADTLSRIVRGNYRFLPYASKFWVEHCLSYTTRHRGIA